MAAGDAGEGRCVRFELVRSHDLDRGRSACDFRHWQLVGGDGSRCFLSFGSMLLVVCLALERVSYWQERWLSLGLLVEWRRNGGL